MKLTIEEEMKLWEERSNSKFGKALKKLDKLVGEVFCYTNEYGHKITPITNLMNTWVMDDVNKHGLMKRIQAVLEDYDMIEDEKIKPAFRACRLASQK